MKTLRFPALITMSLLLLMTSCKKGDTGPAGQDGNANVRLYTYSNITFTGVYNLQLSGISQGLMDSSMVLIYYNPSNEVATSWYPVPGLGSSSAYDMRYLLYQSSTSPSIYTISLRAMLPNGSGSYASQLTFTKVRVFLVPASSVTVGGRGIADSESILNREDYYSVCRYFSIQP
ncbi:MAG: hypothetical protein QM781_14065 [Chitinophagaceae bacterium]